MILRASPVTIDGTRRICGVMMEPVAAIATALMIDSDPVPPGKSGLREIPAAVPSAYVPITDDRS